DCTTAINLPFAFGFYGLSFTQANVSSNGNVQFSSNSGAYNNACLPYSGMDNTIFAFWDDMYTGDNISGQGIFTSISGTSPNRIFNIEWRAGYSTGVPTLNFEVRLYESQGRFDIIYNQLANAGTSATVGVQNGIGYT